MIEVHVIKSLDDPLVPTVWCGEPGWLTASVEGGMYSCPACMLEKGLDEWRLYDD